MDNNLPLIFFQMRNLQSIKEIEDYLPHFKYLDMCISYRMMDPQEKDPTTSIPVFADFCKKHLLSQDDLNLQALQCMHSCFEPRLYLLSDYANEIRGFSQAKNRLEDSSLLTNDVYLCTNQFGFYGAHFLYDQKLLKELSRLAGGSYYVLPSSIHEFLLLPLPLSHPLNYVQKLLSDMNTNELSTVNVLSDNIYYYNQEIEQLTLCPK